MISVKPNGPGSLRSNFDLQPGGRFTAINVSVLPLVTVAYGESGPLTQDRLAISETWPERRLATFERYDIQATAERDLARPDLPRALRHGRSSCGFQSFPGKAPGRVLIADLARRVVPTGVGDGRPVEDKTGLRGTFEARTGSIDVVVDRAERPSPD